MIRAVLRPDDRQWRSSIAMDDIHSAVHATRWGIYGAKTTAPSFWLAEGAGQTGAVSLGGSGLVFSGAFDDYDELAFLVGIAGAGEIRGPGAVIVPLADKLGWHVTTKTVACAKVPLAPPAGFSFKAPPLGEVFAVLQEVFSLPDDAWTLWYWETSYKTRHGLGHVLGLYEQNTLACTGGLYYQNEKAAIIGSVATRPAYRGKGYASALVQRLAQIAQSGGKTPWIVCENPYALSVYEKAGFVRTGEDFYAQKD